MPFSSPEFTDRKLGFYRAYIYESPDGEDCMKKTLHLMKITGFAGMMASLYDIIGVTRVPAETFMLSAGRMASWTVPAAAAGAIFASTVSIAAHARHVDGPLNHVLGGCASGAMYGAVAHNGKLAATFCLAGGSLAGFTKLVVDYRATHEELPRDVGPYGMGFNHYRRFIGPESMKQQAKPPEHF